MLETIRKKKHLSRAELSVMSGVSPEAIYKLESGKTDPYKVQIGTYIELASALKVKVKDILPLDIKEYFK